MSFKKQNKKAKLTDTENKMVGEAGGESGGEGNQKIQTSSHKLNKACRCNVQHGDHNE